MQPNNDLAHPTAPFVPLRGTAGTFGGGQEGSGGADKTTHHYRAKLGKARRRASGRAGCLSRLS
jgi:hypothetical protein